MQGWNGEAVGLAFAIAGARIAVALTASALALRGRMTRT
jgi:hypothetical protein